MKYRKGNGSGKLEKKKEKLKIRRKEKKGCGRRKYRSNYPLDIECFNPLPFPGKYELLYGGTSDEKALQKLTITVKK